MIENYIALENYLPNHLSYSYTLGNFFFMLLSSVPRCLDMCDKYVFNFLRLCGQYPVKKLPTQKWQASKIGIAFNIVFLIAVGVGYKFSFEPFVMQNQILDFAYALVNYSFAVSLLTIGCNPLIRIKKLCGILNIFDDIDGKFSELGHCKRYVKPSIVTIVVVVLISMYTTMTQILEYLFPMWSRGYKTFYFHQGVLFCATLFLANWWYITLQLQVRFAVLNNILAHMQIHSETSSRIRVKTSLFPL